MLLLALVVAVVVWVQVASDDGSHGGLGGGPLCLWCGHSAGSFTPESDAGWYLQLPQHSPSVTWEYVRADTPTRDSGCAGWAQNLSFSSAGLCSLSRPVVGNGRSSRKPPSEGPEGDHSSSLSKKVSLTPYQG